MVEKINGDGQNDYTYSPSANQQTPTNQKEKLPIFIDKAAYTAVNYNAPNQYIQMGLLNQGALGLSSGTNNESITTQIAKLPLTKAGTPDVEKIKQALEIVIKHHKDENQKAYDLVNNYGLYSKVTNGEMGYSAFILGPELTKALKENGLLGENIQNFLKENDSDAIALFPTWDKGDGKDFESFLLKTSQGIKADITEHNKNLDNLLKNLDSKNIEQFLKDFEQLTGTTFDYNGILNTEKILNDPNAPEGEKLGVTLAYYGESVNFVQATKNQLATNITKHAVVNSSCSVIVKAGPVGRIIGNAIPIHVNLVDALTEGAKEGEWINKDNITWEKFFDVNAQIATDCAIINAPEFIKSWVGTGFTKMFKKLGISAVRNGSIQGTNALTKQGVNYLSKSSAIELGLNALDPSGTLFVIKKLTD